MENKEFDNIFKSLEDRGITPSSNALKQLQHALHETDTKDKKKKPMFIWWVAAVVVVLLSVGVGVYTFNKLEEIPTGIAHSETKSIEKSEIQIPNKQVAEVEDEVDDLKVVEKKLNTIDKEEVSKTTGNITEVASTSSTTEEFKKTEEAIKKEEETERKEVLPENATNKEKRIAELLKPVDDAALDSLLQQEQIAIALEKIDDNTILQLLREAQSDLQMDKNMQLASSEADRLLQQAEAELKANRSLRNIFNKAIETGVVQVEALFKQE